MARRYSRSIKNQIAAARDKGKLKQALKGYVELEQIEPDDGEWSRRAAEMYRRLGQDALAIQALERAVDKYVRSGFLVKAIAACKMILQINPAHTAIKERLFALDQERTSVDGPRGIRAPTEASELTIPERSLPRPPAQAQQPAVQRPVPQPAAQRPVPQPAAQRPAQQPAAHSAQQPAAHQRPAPAPAMEQPAPAPQATRRPATMLPPEDFSTEFNDEFGLVPGGAGATTPGADYDLGLALSEPDDIESEAESIDLDLPGPDAPGPRTSGPEADAAEVAALAEQALAALDLSDPTDAGPSPNSARSNAIELSDPMSDIELAPAGPSDPLEFDLGYAGPTPQPVRGRPAPDPSGQRRRPARRTIPPGAALEEINLGEVVPGARQEVNSRGEDSGVFEIPLEVDDLEVLEIDEEDVLEVEARPALGENAQRALRETPLLSSLGPESMKRLIEEVELVELKPGQVLFRQGDMGDALYVVAYGSVSMVAEGPPRVELSNLGEGAFFGEIALVTNQARNATIEAHPQTGAQLLAIARDVIGDLVEEEPAVLQALLRFLRDRLVESLVSTSTLFAPFAGDERRALASRFRFLEVRPGAVVLEQGVKASGFFILLAGRLEAVYRDGAGERILGTLDSGDMFGELSLLSNVPAEVTVRASAKSFLLELPANIFREIIMTHPQVLMVVSDLAETRRRELDRILAGGGDYPPGSVRLV